jgi:hypothetical protein
MHAGVIYALHLLLNFQAGIALVHGYRKRVILGKTVVRCHAAAVTSSDGGELTGYSPPGTLFSLCASPPLAGPWRAVC